MSKLLSFALVLAGLLVLAVVTNPSADRHREQIKQFIGERSQLEKVLGVGHLTAFAARYHTVYVGSYTEVNDELTSVGLFGWVFVIE